MFWRIVLEKDWLPEKVNQLTLEELVSINGLLDMKDDYRQAKDEYDSYKMKQD